MSQQARHNPHGVTLPIYSVTPFTMLDYPGKTACIIWFSGCNMRCAYCHNPQIVKSKGRGDIAQIMDFLKRRAGLLDGVVLSGGECTLYADLPLLIRDIKAMGYAVKIDTNGTRPGTLLPMLESGFIDYVALDYKAPQDKFFGLTKTRDFDAFSRTLHALISKNISFEVRTTVHTDLLDEADINAIIDDLDACEYRGTYYIQNFTGDGKNTLGNLPEKSRPLDLKKINQPQKFKIDFRNFPDLCSDSLYQA